MYIGKKTVIITSISDLCRWLQKENIVIMNMMPTKGIAGEDVLKVEYRYENEEV